MHSYLHTIKRDLACIHRKAVTVDYNSKMIWKHIPTTPLLAYVSYERRGMVTAHIRQESRYPVRKRLIYLQGFDSTWQTAPSQT